jgi:hypothetical protein
MMREADPRQDSSAPEAVDAIQLAETVRTACIEAALRGYEEAKISGLCHEGAWECAVDAVRMLDVLQFVEE